MRKLIDVELRNSQIAAFMLKNQELRRENNDLREELRQLKENHYKVVRIKDEILSTSIKRRTYITLVRNAMRDVMHSLLVQNISMIAHWERNKENSEYARNIKQLLDARIE